MKLTATFKPQAVSIDISGSALSIGTGTPVARDYVERPAYEGPYTITPTAEAQVLETRNLRMTDDVTVKKIPFFETTNETGTTVYIASEV